MIIVISWTATSRMDVASSHGLTQRQWAPFINVPDISTTFRDAASGNFSFSILVMRTSPSVWVDRHLRTWPETTTWMGEDSSEEFSRHLLALQANHVSIRRETFNHFVSAKKPQGSGGCAGQALSESRHCAHVVVSFIIGRLWKQRQLLLKSCPHNNFVAGNMTSRSGYLRVVLARAVRVRIYSLTYCLRLKKIAILSMWSTSFYLIEMFSFTNKFF